jgi:LPXTG-motif cell wall-anchored protein
MYINPFIAGILATVGIELLLIVGLGVYYSRKNK